MKPDEIDIDQPIPDNLPDEVKERIRERQERMRKMKADLVRTDAFQKAEKVDKIATRAKLTAIGIAALVLLAGGVWGANKLGDLVPENQCGFHEHANFRVFDQGRELEFKHPRFDMKYMAMKAHLHQPDDSQIHLEGDCADVSTFFSLMGMKLRPGYLKLDDELHASKELQDNGNDTLRFFLYHKEDGNWTWTEKPDAPDYQLRSMQRLLITYGNLTDDNIQRQQSRLMVLANSDANRQ